jgi:uncharacterized coiled-coil protein SlyX
VPNIEERITALEVKFDEFQKNVLKSLDTLLQRTDNIQTTNGSQNTDITLLKTKMETNERDLEKVWHSIDNLRDETKRLTTNVTRITSIAFGGFVIFEIFMRFILPFLTK